MNDIEGASFLDLFAGTGAVGIEAYSRGARQVVFVDKDTILLEKNVKLLPSGIFRIIKTDISRLSMSGNFDIIYIDPPYELYTIRDILDMVANNNWLNESGIIVYEESTRIKRNTKDSGELPFMVYKEHTYGDTVITYYKHKLLND